MDTKTPQHREAERRAEKAEERVREVSEALLRLRRQYRALDQEKLTQLLELEDSQADNKALRQFADDQRQRASVDEAIRMTEMLPDRDAR